MSTKRTFSMRKLPPLSTLWTKVEQTVLLPFVIVILLRGLNIRQPVSEETEMLGIWLTIFGTILTAAVHRESGNCFGISFKPFFLPVRIVQVVLLLCGALLLTLSIAYRWLR